jgi:hypothetical protein
LRNYHVRRFHPLPQAAMEAEAEAAAMAAEEAVAAEAEEAVAEGAVAVAVEAAAVSVGEVGQKHSRGHCRHSVQRRCHCHSRQDRPLPANGSKPWPRRRTAALRAARTWYDRIVTPNAPLRSIRPEENAHR